MKPIAIVQARMASTRLPGKVLARICDSTLLEYVLHRCKLSLELNGVVLATTTLKDDDPLELIGRSMGVGVFRGSESDVLERYILAAEAASVDVIVRITGDSPLIDPGIIDQVIELYLESHCDYVFISGYPNGLGAAEVLTVPSLRRAYEETTVGDTHYREHVMTYLTDNPSKFSLCIKQAPRDLYRPELRLCVDEQPDLDVVRLICEHFYPRRDFSAREIITFLDRHPEVSRINTHVKQKAW
jgi:spore coat polysaccharide biosynthesis protein SpsF